MKQEPVDRSSKQNKPALPLNVNTQLNYRGYLQQFTLVKRAALQL